MTQVAQQLAQSIEHELQHRPAALGVDGGLLVKLFGRQLDQCVQRQVQARFQQHAQHAQGRAAQRKRIAVAGGALSGGENADQGVHAVGEGDDTAQAIAGQGIA
ncbi:hypothetical protein D3C83_44410 [compost metagenome]